MYEKYCLTPAIEKRSIVRLQCHLLDKEYQAEMPQLGIASKIDDSNPESDEEQVIPENEEKGH